MSAFDGTAPLWFAKLAKFAAGAGRDDDAERAGRSEAGHGDPRREK